MQTAFPWGMRFAQGPLREQKTMYWPPEPPHCRSSFSACALGDRVAIVRKSLVLLERVDAKCQERGFRH